MTDRIPEKFGLDPVSRRAGPDAAGRRPCSASPTSTRNCRPCSNPRAARRRCSGYDTAFRVGDKVMQVQNNYDPRSLQRRSSAASPTSTSTNSSLTVLFDGRSVEYDFNELDELQLAFAISVHKSQGAEYPAVVIPVHTQHYTMLQRNLLYTGDHSRPQAGGAGRQPQGSLARGHQHGNAATLFAVEVAAAREGELKTHARSRLQTSGDT